MIFLQTKFQTKGLLTYTSSKTFFENKQYNQVSIIDLKKVFLLLHTQKFQVTPRSGKNYRRFKKHKGYKSTSQAKDEKTFLILVFF